MENSIKITLIIAFTIILLAIFGYFIVYQFTVPSKEVNVDGVAEIKVFPDIVAIYLKIETNGSSAAIAKDKNSEIEENMVNALIREGFAREDITTFDYAIYEDFEWTEEGKKSLGWKAIHTLRIELSSDKMNLTGKVIDIVVDNGAIINFINFELSQIKENEYKKEALTLATQDAKAKAEGIAEGLGMKVGDVVSVSTSIWEYRPWPMYDKVITLKEAEEAKEAITTIQPGKQTVAAFVSIKYKLI
ncbi:MAG: SIMPL domain-containing protein [Candidatus Pacearchaeota archaeon]